MQKVRRVSVLLAGLVAIQRSRDGLANALCRGLGFAVADMGVAERHARLPVTKQTRDHRQRYSLQHGVACKSVTKVM